MNPVSLWRASCWCYARKPKLLKALNYILFKCVLPYQAIVGKNLELSHLALGVVMHPQVSIGDNCRIYQHVTIAAETWIGSPYRVHIGNDVTLGANSVIVGRSDTDLYIGDGAFVGAGSVVTKSVPERTVVVGVPARPLKTLEKTKTLE